MKNTIKQPFKNISMHGIVGMMLYYKENSVNHKHWL